MRKQLAEIIAIGTRVRSRLGDSLPAPVASCKSFGPDILVDELCNALIREIGSLYADQLGATAQLDLLAPLNR